MSFQRRSSEFVGIERSMTIMGGRDKSPTRNSFVAAKFNVGDRTNESAEVRG